MSKTFCKRFFTSVIFVAGGGAGDSISMVYLCIYGVYLSMVQVLVSVVDVNDLSPLFDVDEYRVTVAENASLHHSVAQVTQPVYL